MQILPAGKVYDIVKAEERFHRQIFKRAADKMRHKKSDNNETLLCSFIYYPIIILLFV